MSHVSNIVNKLRHVPTSSTNGGFIVCCPGKATSLF